MVFGVLKIRLYGDIDACGQTSWLYDVFAPATTLLSMRDLQSRKAVTEARTELGEKMIVVQARSKVFSAAAWLETLRAFERYHPAYNR